MVRLKGDVKEVAMSEKIISIPYGAIKSYKYRFDKNRKI